MLVLALMLATQSAPVDRVPVRQEIRALYGLSADALAAAREQLLRDASSTSEGIPVLDEAAHDRVSQLTRREAVLRGAPYLGPWHERALPKLDELTADEALTLYTTMLMDLELETISAVDCYALEVKTKLDKVCDGAEIFTRQREELPLERRQQLAAVERRLRVAHVDRIRNNVDMLQDCKLVCDELTGRELRECKGVCEEDNAEEKRMAIQDATDAEQMLSAPGSRDLLLQTVTDYGMVFD